jgi:hypothetical protein
MGVAMAGPTILTPSPMGPAAPHQLNEIAVSRHETLGGLTQSGRLSSSHVFKCLNTQEIDDRFQNMTACAIISAPSL